MGTLQLSNKSGASSLLARTLRLASAQPTQRVVKDMRATQNPADASPLRPGGLSERLGRWLWNQRQRDVEAYLAQATDLYDLEVRQRALERNVPHPYY